MANWTRQDLENQTLQLLTQATNTPTFRLNTGTGVGQVTISTSDQLGLWFDEAIERLTKSCYPVRGTGTWTPWAANKRQYLFSDSVGQLDSAGGADNSTLWAVETFTWSGSMIEGPYDRERLIGIVGPSVNISTDTATLPVVWGTEGSNLWVYKIPTTQAAAVGYGYMVPPRLASLATQLDWISDRAAYLLCYYGAGKAALARMDDPILAPLGPLWLGEFDRNCLLLWMQLDESVRARYFPGQPLPINPVTGPS